MAPRPASTMNFSLPTSMSVEGPKRSNLGGGAPLPRRVTRKRSLDSLAMILLNGGHHSPRGSEFYHTLLSRQPSSPHKIRVAVTNFGLLLLEMIEQDEPTPREQNHTQRGAQFTSPRHVLLHGHDRPEY